MPNRSKTSDEQNHNKAGVSFASLRKLGLEVVWEESHFDLNCSNVAVDSIICPPFSDTPPPPLRSKGAGRRKSFIYYVKLCNGLKTLQC